MRVQQFSHSLSAVQTSVFFHSCSIRGWVKQLSTFLQTQTSKFHLGCRGLSGLFFTPMDIYESIYEYVCLVEIRDLGILELLI